jgi:thioredoxin-related protein
MFLKTLFKTALSAFILINMPVYGKEPTSTVDNVASVKTQNTADTNDETRDWSGFFDESLDDLTDEKQTAREEHKKAILIMFEMDDCPFCARMKKTVLNKPRVQDFYKKHFRILGIDTVGDIELTDFNGKETTQKDFSLKQNRVRATPVFQFYDLTGKPLKNGRLTGITKDADEFMLLGQFIAEGKNQEMSFSKYKRSLKK